MKGAGRVVTAKLPAELALQFDKVAERIGRSKTWIVRQAVSEWLADEQRRYKLAIEALDDASDESGTDPDFAEAPGSQSTADGD